MLIFNRDNLIPVMARILNNSVYFVAEDKKLKKTLFFFIKDNKISFLFDFKGHINRCLFSEKFIFFTARDKDFKLFVYMINSGILKEILEDEKEIIPVLFREDLGVVVYNRDISIYNFRGKGRKIVSISSAYTFDNYNRDFRFFLYSKDNKDRFRRIFGRDFYFDGYICFFSEDSPFFLNILEKFKNSRRLNASFDREFIYSVLKDEEGIRYLDISSHGEKGHPFKRGKRKGRIILLINLFILFIFLVAYTYLRRRCEKQKG